MLHPQPPLLCMYLQPYISHLLPHKLDGAGFKAASHSLPADGQLLQVRGLSTLKPCIPNPEPCSHSHSSPAAGLRTITILPPDKSKGPRCTAVGTADGASLLLDPILVLSGPPVAWLAPIEAATKLAVKISIQQAMSDAKRAKKDAWVRNAFLQAAIVSSRIMFTVRPALCETGACLRALTEGMADVDVSANVLGVL